MVLYLTEQATDQEDLSQISHPAAVSSKPVKRLVLVARAEVECKYWLDGFSILISRGGNLNIPLTDKYEEDLKRLVDLELRIRLLGLNLASLPSHPEEPPRDPPNYDFLPD
ncbi:unnamed protein product [Protopolystoma xenopodis]|uniref:PH domain-containing protein n=1 Tax=Protopolystoma xenopodis TaxID=117903 RepID=A0A448WBP3_9PLAT|nr:unnamed protein product [Protopolystoma xenopodis]